MDKEKRQMYLKKCVDAYGAILTMMGKEWDYATAYALVTLKHQLMPHAMFFAKEEMKLAREYAELDENGNIILTGRGTFRFRDPDKAGEYARKRTELGTVEVRERFIPVRMKEPERITPEHLEALEGFVTFGEEEGEKNE